MLNYIYPTIIYSAKPTFTIYYLNDVILVCLLLFLFFNSHLKIINYICYNSWRVCFILDSKDDERVFRKEIPRRTRNEVIIFIKLRLHILYDNSSF